MKCVLSKDAEKDVSEILDFLLKDNVEIANSFVNDFEYTCDMLLGMPKMACEVAGDIQDMSEFLVGVRKWSMKKFKQYVIFYKEDNGEILIFRVINGRRDIPSIFSEWDV